MNDPRRLPPGLLIESLVVGVVVLGGVLTGVASVHSARLAAVVLAVLIATALVVRRPVVLAVLAVPGTFVVQRLGAATATPGAAGGVTYSDALLAGAAVLSLPALMGTPHPARLRGASMAVAAYMASLLPSLLLNRSMRAELEWTHRLVLLLGSALVGAWLVREGAVDLALKLLVRLAGLIGVAALVYSATHGFTSAQPFDLNKNFIGAMLGMALVVVTTAGARFEPDPRLRAAIGLACLAGLIASLSRGGMLGAAFGLLVAFFANSASHRRGTRAAMVVAAGALLVVASISIRDQFHLTRSDFENSSAGQRLTVESATRRIWRTSPIVGVGLRYYASGAFPGAISANNVIDNELAESGLVGAGGFVILQSGVALALWRRRRDPLAGTAIGLVGGQLLHGMVDIYWTAGVVSLPFVLVGMSLAGDRAAGERAAGARADAALPGVPALLAGNEQLRQGRGVGGADARAVGGPGR